MMPGAIKSVGHFGRFAEKAAEISAKSFAHWAPGPPPGKHKIEDEDEDENEDEVHGEDCRTP